MLLVYLHIVSIFFLAHDFHVSKTDINYKPEQRSLQLTVRVFLDDLESALGNYDPSRMNLFTDSEYIKADSLIAIYMSDHINLTTDNNPHSLNYIGKEISDDHSSSWCYIEALDVDEFEILHLTNSIFNEIFDDQRNIIEFKINGSSRDFEILDKDKEQHQIKLE